MSRKRRQESAAGATPPIRKQIDIPYARPADFRIVAADGAIVRIQPNALVIGFYVDDMRVVSQSAELVGVEGNVGQYKAGAMKEEPSRIEQVSVRLTVADALSLSALIVQKAQELQNMLKSGSPEQRAPTGNP